MVERCPVEADVAGSNPVCHPNKMSTHQTHDVSHNPYNNGSHENSHEAHPESNGHESAHSDGIPITLSKYTEALVKKWEQGSPRISPSPNKISVSQTVSFAAFLYEKMRNAVEFREEHLIRRATIERILKRRMILNENGRDIAEPLIKELLWARYYENNTIGQEKILEVQTIIDKYFFLRNEISAGRRGGEQEKIGQFFLEILSCEIEECLSPNPRREAFTNYVYQIIRPYVSQSGWENETEKDVQVYIAVEKNFAHSDNSLIRYHLLRLIIPEITQISWKNSEKILPKIYDAYKRIESDINHSLGDRMRNIIKKQIPPYLILRDIFEQNSQSLNSILKNEQNLKYKVDEACRKRYDESKNRLKRTAFRSFIYILLTKVIFAFIIEVPYDIYVVKAISYIPIAINVIFPPILMVIIILSVTVPGDDNTRRIFQLIRGIVDTDPDTLPVTRANLVVGVRSRSRSLIFSAIFSLLYLFMYVVSFGTIIYVLSLLKFNPVSQGIFIFFVTLVTFFTFKVIQITQEYQVVDHEGILSPLSDFFFLPIIRVGQWLSGEVLTRFNVLIFIFDFVVEMPFKAIVEVFDEWVHFVRLKKEEIM